MCYKTPHVLQDTCMCCKNTCVTHHCLTWYTNLPAGCCFLVGGFRFNTQQFSATVNKASCSLLFLACIAIVIPTAAPVFYSADVISDSSINSISHSTAIILVLV